MALVPYHRVKSMSPSETKPLVQRNGFFVRSRYCERQQFEVPFGERATALRHQEAAEAPASILGRHADLRHMSDIIANPGAEQQSRQIGAVAMNQRARGVR